MSTKIIFENKTFLTVEIFRITKENKEQHNATLLPFQSYTQQTSVDHKWVVRDKHSKEMVSETAGQKDPQIFTVSTEQIRSKNSTNTIGVLFKNNTIYKADVYWVDYEGKEVRYGQLEPGQSYLQSTFSTHPWRIREPQSKAELGLFIPSDEVQQTYDIEFKSTMGEKKTIMNFVNKSNLELNLDWVDYSGKRINYGKIKPYSTFTQSTYATHPWILADQYSGRIVNISTSCSTNQQVSFLNKSLYSFDKTKAVTVEFINETPMAVTVYWVDHLGKNKKYASLRPGDTYNQSTFAQHPWQIRESNSGKIIDVFIPNTTVKQTHVIKVASIESKMATSIKFINKSNLELAIEWMDFKGEPRFYKVLNRGESYNQQTFATHPWIIRDRHSGIVVDTIRATNKAQRMTFSGRKIKSLGGVNPTNVRFVNAIPYEIDLYWINYKGKEKFYKSLKTGEAYTQGTFATHPWRAKLKGNQKEVDLFIPNGKPNQECHFALKSYKGKEVTSTSFYNHTNLPIDAFWVDDKKKKHFFSKIAPKDTFNQKSYEGSKWYFEDQYSDLEIATIAIGKDKQYKITGNGLKSSGTNDSVHVNFHNGSPFTLDIYWINFEGEEVKYNTLAPGTSYNQQTYAQHAWIARDYFSGKTVCLFIPNKTHDQQANFVLKSWNSRKATTISFQNDTMLTTDIYWLDYQGKEQHYKTLKPGGSFSLKTYLTHPWIVKDQQSKQIIETTFGQQEKHKVVINDRDLISKESVKAVNLTFENHLPFTVDIYWLDYKGIEKLVRTLRSGEGFTEQTYVTHTWRVRDHQSQDEIMLYLPNLNSNQKLDINLSSIHSEVPTEIEFINYSPLKVDLCWFDYEGKEVKYATVDPRESYIQQTYMTHPWIVKDHHSQEAIGFTVATRNHQLFEISGSTFRSLRGDKKVNLSMQNGTGYVVDVYWIDYGGKEVKYGSLTQGHNFSVSTFTSHPWRIREQSSQAEIDFFITGPAGNQSYTIKNHLIRATPRTDGKLWSGEVALYEHNEYQGRVWIVHDDLPDFTKIFQLNDQISSVRLGPGTAATIFTDVGFKGTNDVFHMDTPGLTSTDVGDNSISSVQINTIAIEAVSGISSTSRLSQDFHMVNGEAIPFNVYRSIISFPPMVSQVDIWATEELIFTAEDQTYTVDPVKPTRLNIDVTGKLVLLINPDKLGNAALMIRTNTMGKRERFFVFPDADVNTKLATMDSGTLWNNKTKLGIDSKFSKADVDNVQTALQNLSRTIPAVHNKGSQGQTKDLYIVSETMDYNAWELNLGADDRSGDAIFRPVDPQTLKQINDKAVMIDDKLGQGFLGSITGGATSFIVETVSRGAKEGVKVGGQIIEDTGQVVVDTGNAVIKQTVNAGNAIAETGKTAWNKTEDMAEEIIKETGETFDDIGDAVTDAVGEVVDFAEDLGEGIAEIGETVIRATIQIGEEFVQIIIDTVEKIGEFTMVVIEAIGSAWDKFVEFLKDVFFWTDILETHDYILKGLNNSIDGLQDLMELLKKEIQSHLKYAKNEVVRSIDAMIEEMGNSDAASGVEADVNELGEAMDKLNWIISKVFGGFGKFSSLLENDDNPRSVDPLIQEAIDKIAPDKMKKLHDLTDSFVVELEKVLTEDSSVILNSFIDSFEYLFAALKDPHNVKDYLVSALLSLAKAIALVGFNILDFVIIMLFDLIILAIELFQLVINKNLNIPFISGLYTFITAGRDLTPLSLMSLIIAIPTTILSKIMFGGKPFNKTLAMAQGYNVMTSKEAQAMAQGYACVHIILGVIDTISDFNTARPILKVSPNDMVEIINGEVHNLPSAQGPGSLRSMSKMEIVLSLFTNGLTLAGQLLGPPTVMVNEHSGLDISQGLKAKKSSTIYWSHVIWIYQWGYLGIGLLDFISTYRQWDLGYFIPTFTTIYGGVHLGLMARLVHADSEETKEKTNKPGIESHEHRRRGTSWLFDTFPPFGKIGSIRELNEKAKYIPLAVNSALNVVGHYGEAIAYLDRAIDKDV